jgi:predicted PurR-regulated permease PerM
VNGTVAETSLARAAFATVVAAGVIAALYYGQIVLIPAALAVLLAFLLSPLVHVFERLRAGRVGAVLAVGVVAYAALGAAAWTVTMQTAALVAAVPGYRANIRQKIADVRGMGRGGSIERLQDTLKDAAREASEQERAAAPRPPPETERVVVEADRTWDVWALPAMLGSWLSPLGTLGLVAVLVPFMLLERTALTDRVIRLMGRRRLVVTTRMLEEAAARVTRYLLMQTIVNVSYGALVALGLWALGLPYAILWGFLAAVLRFIPYVGPLVAALAPLVLSLAVFEGWTRPILVAVVFVVIELFSNLVLETVLYAGSAGVSQVMLLVAVAFWTALWGPIGLVLATPLTVCVLVFAKHLPALRFLVVLMSDERAVTADVGFYQRLLADDPDGATRYLDEWMRLDAGDPYDTVFICTLQHARRDRAANLITTDDEDRVVDAVARAAEALGAPVAASDDAPDVVGCPAVDRADEVALGILAGLAATDGVAMEVMPAALPVTEAVARIEGRPPRAVVIGALAPEGLAEARQLEERLATVPSRPSIIVARWGENAARAGAPTTRTVRTLAEARTRLREAAALPHHPRPPHGRAPKPHA